MAITSTRGSGSTDHAVPETRPVDVHAPTDWRLALRAGLVAGLAAVAKLVFDLAGWATVGLNPLHSGLVAATVFLLGFLLAGTLADYKESERLPGELAARTEAIADECQILFADKEAEPARRCLEHLGDLAHALDSWLNGREGVEAPLDRIQGLNRFFLEFEPLTQPNFIVRLKQEQSALRLLVTRIDTIKETSFVGAGYLIAEITATLLLISLLVVDIAPLGAALLLLAMIAFVVVYMILLIRDLDDPFEYDRHGRRGAAEVSLAPIDRLERRMAAQAEALPGGGGRSSRR
ncbi:MAG TPA: hypothetical protein VF520_16430 [Thermoleophilaceae bacterium]|jgi:hypothetical protein